MYTKGNKKNNTIRRRIGIGRAGVRALEEEREDRAMRNWRKKKDEEEEEDVRKEAHLLLLHPKEAAISKLTS